MEKIYIGFIFGGALLSRIICWLTRSDVSHAVVVYKDTLWGGWWVAEANIHGVHTRPIGKKPLKYLFEPKYNIKPALHAARQYIDEHYDFLGLITFGWILFWWRVFKLRLRAPFRNSHGQICSEFIARVVKDVLNGKNPQWVSPEDLKTILSRRTDMFNPVDLGVIK